MSITLYTTHVNTPTSLMNSIFHTIHQQYSYSIQVSTPLIPVNKSIIYGLFHIQFRDIPLFDKSQET